LTETALPIADVALAAGFGSVRRLNELLKSRYGLTPANFRRQAATFSVSAPLALTLAVRSPYAWAEMLSFLAKRSIAGVESVAAGEYRRSLCIGEGASAVRGTVSVRQARDDALTLTVSESLLPALPQVLARIRRLFDCEAEPHAVAAALGPLATPLGLRVAGAVDGFEVAVRAILGQQVTVKAAITLAGRVVAAFGDALPESLRDAHVTHTFPSPERLAQATPDAIASLGIIQSRARAIIAVGEALATGRIRLTPGADVAATQAALIELPGIGEWTAQYITLRALGWPDVFLPGDLGVRKALGDITPRAANAAAEAWRPFRAYAVMHLWHQLEATPREQPPRE
jgi:AraC family transcriptional regulator, regulatory protein of adaptative response / DNA-3-methyladenine glycosylase II